MKPEEQRIAIAEACGWRITSTTKYSWVVVSPSNMECAWSSCGGEMNDRPAHSYLPDYINDLNAMHEAEKSLQHYGVFVDNLATVMKQPRQGIMLVHATSAQRAEAFLRTLNLWDRRNLSNIDKIFDKVDMLMCRGDLEILDNLLLEKLNIWDIDERLAYLTTTLPVKNNLVTRPIFYEKTEKLLRVIGEDVEKVLKGLK